MGFISQAGEEELIFSFENLKPQIIMASDLENRKIDPGEPGIYIFLENIRPHHVYIGSTGNIGRRTFEQRRLHRIGRKFRPEKFPVKTFIGQPSRKDWLSAPRPGGRWLTVEETDAAKVMNGKPPFRSRC